MAKARQPMTRGAIHLRLTLAIFLSLGAVGLGGFYWHHREIARQAWAAARPARPVSKNWPSEFQQRIHVADAQVALWPPETKALGDLARLYLANGFQREAEQSLRALLVYDPQNARWPHYLATLRAGYGQLDDAIAEWRRVATLVPDYRPARLKLGEALLKTNRLSESEKVYNDLLAESPADLYAELGLAQVNVSEGRWGAAREHLEAAVQTEPLFSAGWALLATVDERLGDATQSEHARDRANLLGRFKDPPDPWVDELVEFCYDPDRLEVMAATRVASGESARAVPILERAIQIAPSDSRPHRQLGKVYAADHREDLAREQLQQAIALQSTDPRAYLDLASIERAQNNLFAALNTLQLALKNCPDTGDVQPELAMTLIADNRTTEALPYLQKALQLAPDNPAIYQALAHAQSRLGHVEEAIATLKAGLQHNPESAGMLAALAGCEIEIGDANSAEQDLIHAQKADPHQGGLAELVQAFGKKFDRAPR
jgi:tetratricopeptide (TPR) repeat protein